LFGYILIPLIACDIFEPNINNKPRAASREDVSSDVELALKKQLGENA